MNFLAHFHLSGNHEMIAMGNFVGDFMKGNRMSDFPESIQQGIHTHRFIDSFTDSHPLVKETNKILTPYFAKYASVVSDIYFDFFLAANFTQYSDQSLRDYTQRVYQLIEKNLSVLPPKARRFYRFLLERDIFFEYGNKGGLQHVFNGISQRASFDSKMENGVGVLTKHEEELAPLFHAFYPQLQEATENYIAELLNKKTV